MTRGVRGSAFDKGFNSTGMFDKVDTKIPFFYDKGSLTSNRYGDFADYQNLHHIYKPETEKSLGDRVNDFLNFKLQKPDEDSTASKIAEGIYKSYRPEEKSSQEMIADLVASRLGVGGSGVQDLGGGLRMAMSQGGGLQQPMYIAGQKGSGGIGGALKGAAGGFLSGGGLGAAIGGVSGFFG